jgi:hypothetical protein
LIARSNFSYRKRVEEGFPWTALTGYYNSLLDKGRIWELRDLISSSHPTFGGAQTWETLFSEDLFDANFPEKFLNDWGVSTQHYDESRYLATLAILVDLCQGLLSISVLSFDKDVLAIAKRCLEHARMFAACIKENDLLSIKSRPYISLIIVQKGLERHLADNLPGTKSPNAGFNSKYMKSLPGLTVWTSILPIYVPLKSENSGWPVSEQPANSDELLQHALKASQELGDYRSEVACLREMICRSSQPKELFERLCHVQKTLQGDMVGYLETLLSKYLLITNEESRQSLRDELSAFDALQPISYDIQDPLIQWCQRMVQAALYRFSGRHAAETNRLEQMAEDLIDNLPHYIYEEALNFSIPGRARTRRIPTNSGGITVAQSIPQEALNIITPGLASRRIPADLGGVPDRNARYSSPLSPTARNAADRRPIQPSYRPNSAPVPREPSPAPGRPDYGRARTRRQYTQLDPDSEWYWYPASNSESESNSDSETRVIYRMIKALEKKRSQRRSKRLRNEFVEIERREERERKERERREREERLRETREEREQWERGGRERKEREERAREREQREKRNNELRSEIKRTEVEENKRGEGAEFHKAGLDARPISSTQDEANITDTRLPNTKLAHPPTEITQSRRDNAQTIDPNKETKVFTNKNIEADTRTISPSREVHQRIDSSPVDAVGHDLSDQNDSFSSSRRPAVVSAHYSDPGEGLQPARDEVWN